jgi:3-isopropylmalate/(R)-2-methylmalate dehydratase small subunit
VEFKGKIYLFGDDVNTDEIIPARFLNTTDLKTLARYCMEDARPGFGESVEAGSIIVAGGNFGCGSSREHAPLAIKHAGISTVIAASFARIFFRNCINIGLPIIESPEVSRSVSEGDSLRVDLNAGKVTLEGGKEITINPFPVFMQAIVEDGGWIAYLKKRYGF